MNLNESEIYRKTLPKRCEKFFVGKNVYYAVFDGYKSKNTVKLNECAIYKSIDELSNELKTIAIAV